MGFITSAQQEFAMFGHQAFLAATVLGIFGKTVGEATVVTPATLVARKGVSGVKQGAAVVEGFLGNAVLGALNSPTGQEVTYLVIGFGALYVYSMLK